jgi:pimeloyl-ACP methyl ester carboxylesterase
VSLAFERSGSGPALVLLHGLGHRRQGWSAVVDLLTPHREVFTVDLPGHGESPPLRLDGRSPAQAMADDALAFLDEQRLDRPHVAGNSLGGMLALTLAAHCRAASVTALSPAGFAAHDYQVRYAKAIFTGARLGGRAIRPLAPMLSRSVLGRAALYGPMVSRPGRVSAEQARGDVAGFVAAGDAMCAVFRAPEQFTAGIGVGVPITIAWGTRDRILPQSNARVARGRLPQTRFVPLPGCGHVPMTDDPELVAKVLLEGSGG